MKCLKHKPEDCLVAVIDIQENFLKSVPFANHLVNRSKFLLQCANELGVQSCATEQYPQRMGGTIPEISELIMGGIFPKLSFSAGGSDEFNHMVNQSGKRRIVLVGVETHICITGTALDLLAQGFEVTLALDAIGSRIAEAHSIGIARLLAAGAIGAHTESIVYEWMGTAAHEKFKTILNFVKSDSNSVDN